MQSNRQLTRGEWVRHVECAKTSSLSVSAYCRKRGFKRSTMDNWQRKVRVKSGASLSVLGFVRVVVIKDQRKDPVAKWVAEFLSHFLEVQSYCVRLLPVSSPMGSLFIVSKRSSIVLMVNLRRGFLRVIAHLSPKICCDLVATCTAGASLNRRQKTVRRPVKPSHPPSWIFIKIYDHQDELAAASPEQKIKGRGDKQRPWFESIKAITEQDRQKGPDKSKLGTVFRYFNNEYEYLTRYLAMGLLVPTTATSNE